MTRAEQYSWASLVALIAIFTWFQAIEARANQNERIFIIIAVNVLIWQVLWEGMWATHARLLIDVTRLPVLVFVLFALLFGGELVKRVSTIWMYRV